MKWKSKGLSLDGEVDWLGGVVGGFDVVVDSGAWVVNCIWAAVVFCCILSWLVEGVEVGMVVFMVQSVAVVVMVANG